MPDGKKKRKKIDVRACSDQRHHGWKYRKVKEVADVVTPEEKETISTQISVEINYSEAISRIPS